MNDVSSKIKFYSLGSEKIDFSKIISNDLIDSSKPIIVSNGFNKALKSVINKDINFLDNKLKSILKEIKKILVVNEFEEDIDGNIENINDVVDNVEKLISKVIIKKGSIKVNIFSTNKKVKKGKQKSLDNAFDVLSKYQTELISIKNEYNKLIERKDVLKDTLFEETYEEDIKEDPLERTINFYMSKQN